MSADPSLRNEQTIAVFVDFENLAFGVEEDKKGRFDIELVLKRLLERGRIVFKRAYCDWTRFKDFMHEFHRHGFEMVDIPSSKVSGKNSADIRMVVDAIDLCYSKTHIDTFVLLTGDSDFSPVVSKLKENNKRVVGCGVRSSTSDLLANNCDEFIFYDDLIRVQKRTQTRQKPKKESANKGEDKAEDKIEKRRQEAFDRLAATVASLESDYDPVWGSLVKPTLKRVYPGFNESYYGYRNFTELLEDAAKEGVIKLELDEQRGNYKVR
ncbi:MAG TPA: NYN domain-containing protein, partial [Gammaproteobacteria bacterium]|nr:NYN domain-containing protein [Gammaproteobacteria bacterium]